MNSVEYPDDSDSSDEDYVPGCGPAEVLSEVESEGDDEDSLSDKEDLGSRSTKRKKKNTKIKKKLKKETNKIDSNGQETLEKTAITEVEKKKLEDDLWATFKKETNFKAKPTTLQSVKSKETKENDHSEQKKLPEKIKITQIFEFAGEEVKVEKEIPVNSAEAKLFNNASGSDPPRRGKGKAGGIGSLLNQLGKKQKITTLEKSKLDWDKFKKEENLEEELHNFNKGKDGHSSRRLFAVVQFKGRSQWKKIFASKKKKVRLKKRCRRYLDRQDFLQRTDLRRFEIEREVRNIERNKRMNNV